MTGLPTVVTAAAAAAGVLLVAGVWAVVLGMRPQPRPARRITRAIPLRLLAVGLGIGVLASALTGWLVWIVVTPVMVVLVPRYLREVTDPEIELLAALDRWVRYLAASLGTGRSVVDAMSASAATAPVLLTPSLSNLSRRLDERWSPTEALHAMADELDSPAADTVIAALMLASQRGGTGITTSLRELSDSLQRRLGALREIAAERAKPRIVLRQMSLVMVAVIGIAAVVGRDFFAPYSTAVGQIVLAGLVAAYLWCLMMVQRMTSGRRRTRILRGVT